MVSRGRVRSGLLGLVEVKSSVGGSSWLIGHLKTDKTN